MPRNTPLRNRVKELRERLNVRQSALAREVGVTRQTIIAIEKGRLNPSVLISLKIAKMLREPVDYVFYLQPGFDYEQEARENADRPKRGRKKRSVVPSPPAEPVPVAAATFEAERDAAAEATDYEEQEVVAVTADAPAEAEPARKPRKRKTEQPVEDTQQGDDTKTGQAIWDFF